MRRLPPHRSIVLPLALVCVGTPAEVLAISAGMATAKTLPRAVSPKLLGGWCAPGDGADNQHGEWLGIAKDGTWRWVRDHFGFRAEYRGAGIADGEALLLRDGRSRLELSNGGLRWKSPHGQGRHYARCGAVPPALAALPTFPRTVQETVALLTAVLRE